jgi:SAM-dependent methyltransferase
MASDHYAIRGGADGRERLRLLSRVMSPTTLALLDRVGVPPGAACLDVGCGGGDVTVDLARRAGARGRAVGVDLDEEKLAIARAEAKALGVKNVEYRQADAGGELGESAFGVVYARFLLSHLSDPAACLRRARAALAPGGVVVVEDIDLPGSFCHPPSQAFAHFVELYAEAVRRRGGDAAIGPRLPRLLLDAGFERVCMNVVQPAGIEGEAKLLAPLTLENIADAVVADGLVTREELERLVARLYEFARDPRTVVSAARVIQAWGCRPVVGRGRARS